MLSFIAFTIAKTSSTLVNLTIGEYVSVVKKKRVASFAINHFNPILFFLNLYSFMYFQPSFDMLDILISHMFVYL